MTDPLGPVLDADLELDLDPIAERYTIRSGDPSAAIARAGLRDRRRRGVAALFALVAVVVTSVTFMQTRRTGDRGTPLQVAESVSRGSLGLTWRAVDPSSALGMSLAMTTSGTTSGGPLYALSTAPGEKFSPTGDALTRVVWTSDDGVEWRPASTLGNDLYLADLTSSDRRVYAVGTAPATVVTPGRKAVSPLVVGWSDDGAKKWQKKELPIDWAALASKSKPSVSSSSIASGPNGVLAVALLRADLNMASLLPAGVTAPNGWATSETGIDVLGAARRDACPNGKGPITTAQPSSEVNRGQVAEVGPMWCPGPDNESVVVMPQQSNGVVRSFTWAELGIDGDLLKAMRREPIAFLAAPGSTDFERVELPQVATNAGQLAVDADAAGFTIATSTSTDRYGVQSNGLAVLQSPDGRTWARGSRPADAQWVSGVGQLGGRTSFVATNERGLASLVTSDGAGGWRSQSLSTVLDPDVVAGNTVAAGSAAFGPFGLAVSVVIVPNRSTRTESDITRHLLLTRDGHTWEDIALEDLVGEPGAIVSRLSIVGDQVVVAVGLAPKKGEPVDARSQRVLVGH